MSTRGRLTAVLILSSLLTSGCAHGPTGPTERGKINDRRFSRDDEREIETGKQIHQAILSSFHVYTEPRLVGYVRRIGRRLARAAERKNLDYRFTVLYDDRAYATEAPGGYVYVTTGFLNFLQNEAELSAVLAHELAQLQFRDPRFSAMRRALSLLTQTGAVVAPFFGQVGALAATAAILLHSFAESRQDSPQERIEKADAKALRYLVAAREDPQGYLDLLSRFLNLKSEWSPYFYDYLTSRPMTVFRYQHAMKAFEGLPLEEKSFTVNRERYLEMTKGVRQWVTR